MSNVVSWMSDLGESIYKPLAGEKTSKQIKKEKDATAAGQAAADASIRQAEYEEQAAMGTERTRSKKRRGFSSTVLTGGAETLGGGLADSGKTLLGS